MEASICESVQSGLWRLRINAPRVKGRHFGPASALFEVEMDKMSPRGENMINMVRR